MEEYAYPIISDEQNLPFYVIGFDYMEKANNTVKSDGNPYYQLVYCISGSGIVILDDVKSWFSANECIFIPPDTPFEFLCSDNFVKVAVVIFSGNNEKDILNTLGLQKACKILVRSDDNPLRIILKIKEKIIENPYFNGAVNSSLLYSLLTALSFHYKNNCNKNRHTKCYQIKPIIDYINKNYSRDITLEELCELVSLSPQYICKLFKECLNSRPFEYLTNVRIHYSKILIITTQLSINEVSEKVGYKDCSYFCAVFKRHQGSTPIDFRNKYSITIE